MRIPLPGSRKLRWAIAATVATASVAWTWYTGQQKFEALQDLKQMGGKLVYEERPALLRELAGFAQFDEDRLPATLIEINLWQSLVRDSDLPLLELAPEAVSVDLSETEITDAGLVHVTRLPSLRSLNLRRTRIGDAGLQHLVGCDELTWLDLTETDITDQGLQTIATIPNLRYVNLFHTQTTVEAVRTFRAKHDRIQWRR